MADLRLNTPQAVIPALTSDVKTRTAADGASADLDISSSQFLDVMMSGVTAGSHRDTELKTAAQKAAASNADASAIRKQAATDLAETRAKIKARLKELAEKDPQPVRDTTALKAMKKVANFLLKASDEGKIDLPKEITDKLQEFVDKGDDLKAYDITAFMRDFIDVFRTINIAFPANAVAAANGQTEALTWPQDILDAFKEVGMNGTAANPDKALTVMDVLRAVKSLAVEGENAAIATIDEIAKETQLPQDRASLMVTAAPVTEKKATKPATTVDPLAAGATIPGAPNLSLTQISKEALLNARNKSDKSSDDSKPSDTKSAADAPSRAATVSNAVMAAEAKLSAAFTAQEPVQPNFVAGSGVEGISFNAKASVRAPAVAVPLSQVPSTATQQVIAQIQTRADKATQISVQLTPAELGRVEVRLSIQRDGQTHAVIVVDRPETLALMQKDAGHLERALQQAGLNANSENMSFNLRDGRQAQEFDQGRKRFSRAAIGDENGIDVAVNVIPESIISDNRINYHA
jgi:Flagellar hook-length control protein FliK